MKNIMMEFPAELFIRAAEHFKKVSPDIDPTDEIAAIISRHLAQIEQLTADNQLYEELTNLKLDDGDLDGGLVWSPIFLRNGTLLRMRYRSRFYVAKVRFDLIEHDGEKFETVSQWVRKMANNTARNAWHDVWIRRPGDDDYIYADSLRQGQVPNISTTDFRKALWDRAAQLAGKSFLGSVAEDEDG